MLTILAAAEDGAHQLRDIGIHPYGVGLIAMGILTAAMLLLLAFGKGREHT